MGKNASERVLLGIFELYVDELEQNYDLEVFLLATGALGPGTIEFYLLKMLQQLLKEDLSERFRQILSAELAHRFFQGWLPPVLVDIVVLLCANDQLRVHHAGHQWLLLHSVRIKYILNFNFVLADPRNPHLLLLLHQVHVLDRSLDHA